MKTIVCFYRRNFDLIFLCFGIIVMLSVLVATFLALPNNLVISDEGWYLCLLRDTPQSGATRFHLLFHNVFKNNIYAIRLTCWLFQLFGSLVLSWGITLLLCLYCKNIKVYLLYLFVLCTLYFGQMNLTSCPSINYITLNKVFAELGIGLMLIGLVRRKMAFFVLSGFFIAFLFPTMITNVIIIPFMFVVLMLLSENRRRDGWGFVLGVALFFLYYFIAVESPKEVLRFFSTESKKVVEIGSADYGWLFYVRWLLHTLFYLCRCLIVAVIIFAIGNKLKGYTLLARKRNYFLAILVVSVIVLLYSWTYLEPLPIVPFPYKDQGSILWYRDLYWIFVFLLVLSALKTCDSVEKEKLLLGCLFLVTPICLCFGSNVLFPDRQREYMLFVMPVLVFGAMKKSIVWKTVMMGILMGGYIVFFSSLFGRNIAGDKYFGGHTSVKTIGIEQNVRLSQGQLSKLVNCRNHVPKGRVLCGSWEWWMVALLDYTPISYEYSISRNSKETIQQLIDEEMKNEEDVWAISNVWEEGFVEKMDLIEGYEKKVDTVGDNLFYHFWKVERTSINTD